MIWFCTIEWVDLERDGYVPLVSLYYGFVPKERNNDSCVPNKWLRNGYVPIWRLLRKLVICWHDNILNNWIGKCYLTDVGMNYRYKKKWYW